MIRKDSDKRFAHGLLEVVATAYDRLITCDDDLTAMQPSPDKWSAKEVMGHLIDSAANNHRRLVLGLIHAEFMGEGYRQDEWVAVQSYQDANWQALLTLWKSYNLHICHIISQLDEGKLEAPIASHNFNQFGFRELDDSDDFTLGRFIADYSDHIEHHLRQISEMLDVTSNNDFS